MESPDSELHRALDLAAQGKLEEAQAILAARTVVISQIRHDLGNALAIAQASIEAMLDGVVPITDPRLNRVREILGDAGELLLKLGNKEVKDDAKGVEFDRQ